MLHARGACKAAGIADVLRVYRDAHAGLPEALADVADDGAIKAPRAAPARRGGTRGEARRDARARAAAGRRAVGIDAARATERTVMATRPALSAMWVQISIRRDATTTGWNVFTRSSRMAAVFGRFFSRNELG